MRLFKINSHIVRVKALHKVVSITAHAVIVPLCPIFLDITKQLPVFLKVIIIVMIGHYIWLTVLYVVAGVYSGKNPIEVVKHYGPAYITAVGTMSSAATLAVALRCARKSKVLREDMVDFGVPLFANIHLCGSKNLPFIRG